MRVDQECYLPGRLVEVVLVESYPGVLTASYPTAVVEVVPNLRNPFLRKDNEWRKREVTEEMFRTIFPTPQWQFVGRAFRGSSLGVMTVMTLLVEPSGYKQQ